MQILSAYLAGIRCYHVLVDMQYDFVVDFNPESGFFDLTDYGMNTLGRNYFIAGLQSVAEFLYLFPAFVFGPPYEKPKYQNHESDHDERREYSAGLS